MENYFQKKIINTCCSFKNTLKNCDLLVKFDEGADYEDWNGCPEINITYHFAKQFDPYCFFHVPFMTEEAYKKSKKAKYNNHFDAFVYDPQKQVAIIVEAKRLFNSSRLTSLLNDCDRINKNLGSLKNDTGIASILHRFEERQKIHVDRRKVFSLILAETWQEDIGQWWELSKSDFNRKRKDKSQGISRRRHWDQWNKKCEGSELNKYDHFSSVKVFDKLPTISSPLFCCYAFKRVRGVPK